MHKGRSQSMQRGAGLRSSEPYVSSSDLYAEGAKIKFTDADRVHFEHGARDNAQAWFQRIAGVARACGRNGLGKPKDVARILNEQGLRTIIDDQWTPRLAWFLLNRIYNGSYTAKKPEPGAPKVVSAPRPAQPNPQKPVIVETPARGRLTKTEIDARRRALAAASASTGPGRN